MSFEEDKQDSGFSLGSFTRRRLLKGLGISGISLLLPYSKLSAKSSDDNTYRLATHGTVTYTSPFHPGRNDDQPVIFNVHEALYEMDQEFDFQPVLAKNHEVSGNIWTFHLREGVLFHDGTEFTAEDVKYTFEWAMDEANGAETSTYAKKIDEIKILDKYTVQIETKEPYAPFLSTLGIHRIVPKHYHEKMSDDKYKQSPMGTGPFKFQEWEPGDHLTMKAFDDYWGGRPKIDYYKVLPIPEASTRAMALESGKVDSVNWTMNPEDTKRLMKEPNLNTISSPSLAVNHYLMNHLNPFFQDKKVRQAMMYALNRKAVSESIMQGLSEVADTYVSPALNQWYEPDVKKYPYEPGTAEKLLREAGWEKGSDGIMVNQDGEKFEITCELLMGDEVRTSQAEIDAQYLRQVGIKMNLNHNEMGVWVEKMVSGADGEWNYDLSLQNWGFTEWTDPHCAQYFTCDGGNNWTQWCNKEMDQLVKRGAEETDPEKRKEIYSKAQKIFSEEVPFLFIQYWKNTFFISKDVKGVPEDEKVNWPFNPVFNIKDYYIERS